MSPWLCLLLMTAVTFPAVSAADVTYLATINARDYIAKFKEVLALGDCPSRAISGKEENIVRCSLQFRGVSHHIPLASSSLEVKRVQTTSDVLSHGAGGLGVGVGVVGIVGVNVKVKVGVTTQTNRRLLTLMTSYRLQRGVQTLRDARPLMALSETEPTPLYLSEVVLGGEESLVVTMEFESEKKRVEVETTVTLKILFISISAKVRFVKDTFSSASSVKVELLSSWRESQSYTFVGPGSLDQAVKMVEELERKYEKAPGDLQALELTDQRLHLEYRFNTWAPTGSRFRYNVAQTTSRMDRLARQMTEIEGVLATIKEYLESENLVPPPKVSQRHQLQKLRDDLEDTQSTLTTSLANYLTMTEEERRELPDIYGRHRAPFYFRRQMDAIYRPTAEI